ncbi:MAG TPA: ABC-2 family transporter protein [Acidimicrobiales bacterium]|nr:ABC-2 family transporter protein [Acidimicrobiales bacterium]
MASPRRLMALWGTYARMNLVLLMRSKQQFVTYIVGDLLARAGTIAAVLLLAERFEGIGGWSQAELMFLLGYGLMVSGVEMLFFSYNVSAISRRIGRGQLDHSLLQPQPLWVTFVTEGFAPLDALALMLPAALMMGVPVLGGAVALTPSFPLLLAGSLVASTVVLVAFNFLFGAVAFWAPQGAEELSPAATGLLQSLKIFPLDIAGPALRTLLTSVVPAGFLAWMPATALLGRSGPSALAATFVAAAAVATIATFTFQKGLTRYGKTGSQRYSEFGHRR